MFNILNLAVALMIAAGSAYLYANEEREMEMEHKNLPSTVHAKTQKDAAAKVLYQKECGACHMAYQPEFLSKRSWEKMMGTLENHFGTDATLDSSDQKTIHRYLLLYASANDRIRGSRGEVPMRISQTAYFISEHREIPKKMVAQSAVKSFANCTACHTQAASGSYREHEIRIPNYGRWND